MSLSGNVEIVFPNSYSLFGETFGRNLSSCSASVGGKLGNKFIELNFWAENCPMFRD